MARSSAVVAVVVAQHRGEQPELHGGVDLREVVGAGDAAPRPPPPCPSGWPCRTGRAGTRAGSANSRSASVYGGLVRHRADRERVVVVDLLPRHVLVRWPRAGARRAAGPGSTARCGSRCAICSASARISRRLGGVAELLVRLRGGQRAAVLVRRLGAVQPAVAPVERHRVGVVAGERAPVVLDEVVAVVVVEVELAADVALGVAGQVLHDRPLAAVDLVAAPGGLGDVLRVRVRPVLRVARVVDEPARRATTHRWTPTVRTSTSGRAGTSGRR